MLKNVYYVRTNGYDMLVSESAERIHVLTDDRAGDMPDLPTPDQAEEYLKAVEDDSSWSAELDPAEWEKIKDEAQRYDCPDYEILSIRQMWL